MSIRGPYANITLEEWAQTQDSINLFRKSENTSWLLSCTFMVFLMQLGFAMLEASAIRAKNVVNVMLKNVIDTIVGCVSFFVFGYAFAYGSSASTNPFIGFGNFLLIDSSDYAFFLFQWAFAATATTIVSGCMAERTTSTAYLILTAMIATAIYPVCAHWVWSPHGWLFNLGENGVIDFAGGAVVHCVGGGIGLIGCILLGPRRGRFRQGRLYPMHPHSMPLNVLGVLILWYGWYGFNAGSVIQIVNGPDLAAKIAVVTTLSASSAGITVLAWVKARQDVYDLGLTLNGVLAGLVAITPGCGTLEPWAALVTGLGAGFAYLGASHVLLRLRIDDPLDGAPVHLGCGMYGMIVCGLFSSQKNIEELMGRPTSQYGLVYGGGFEQLGVQLVAIISIVAWSVSITGVVMYLLRRLWVLRVDAAVEMVGLDVSEHGRSAYEI